MKQTNKAERTTAALAITGLLFNFVLLFFCLPFFNVLVFLILIAPPIGMIPLLSPFVGITLGISGMVHYNNEKTEKIKKRYFVLSLIDVLLPIVAIVTYSILLGTGVLILRFM